MNSVAEISPFATEAQREAWPKSPSGTREQVDVVVVGGGLSGVAAAVAAARRGSRVALVERTHLLGGQATAAGVAAADVTFAYVDALHGYGLWGEVVTRIEALYRDEYRLPVNTCRYRKESFGPNPIVVERVLTEMANEAGVIVVRNAQISGVIRTQGHVCVYYQNGWIKGVVAIDATEEGQLLDELKADYRIGNVISRRGLLEHDALKEVLMQSLTQTVTIRRYLDGSIPDWARFDKAPPEYEKYRAPISRAYPAAPGGTRKHPNGFAGYRATANLASEEGYDGSEWQSITKTSLNYLNDVEVTAAFFFDAEERQRVEREAMCRTLAVLYFIQCELGLPWAVADDEGYADGPNERVLPADLEPFRAMLRHFPIIPYIREARRGIGRSTVTGKHIFRKSHHDIAPWNVDAIAVGTYAVDLHGARGQFTLESDLDESYTEKPQVWREGPFPIPMGALVSASTDRLIFAEKNVSSSRIANSAMRLHPTVVAIGEAAGVLAAIAVRKECAVSEVPAIAVQMSLVAGGSLLAPMRIAGLSRDDPEFADVCLAVCRQLVEIQVEPVDKRGAEGSVRVDIERANLLGRMLREAYSEWEVKFEPTAE